MARAKKVLAGLAFGYLQIVVNIGYVFISIPLALNYLSKDGFGVWILVTQVSGYLLLIEAGLSPAVARILSDYKDDIRDHNYANAIRTGSAVFLLKSLVLLALGISCSFVLPKLLSIPNHLKTSFTSVLILQSFITAFQLATRITGTLLWSHQRHDLIGIAGILNLSTGLLAMWIGFFCGLSIYSLPLASFIGYTASLIVTVLANRKHGYNPPKDIEKKFDPKLLKEFSKLGSGLFLINIGNQIAAASPVFVASRILGLEAATTWAIASKSAFLSQAVVGRIYESAAPTLAEMTVRGEDRLFKKRFLDVLSLTAFFGLSAFAGVTFLNEPLLYFWTRSTIAWPNINDFALGFWVLSTAIVKCYINAPILKKNTANIGITCIMEGLVTFALSWLLAQKIGFLGILVGVIVSNVFITGSLSLRATINCLELNGHEIKTFLIRLGSGIALIGTGFYGRNLFYGSTSPPLFFNLIVVSIMIPVLLFLIVRPSTRNEIFTRAQNFKLKQKPPDAS